MKKYITIAIILSIIEINLALYLTFWRETWWNTIAQKQSMQFLQQLSVFVVVALVCGFINGYSNYLTTLAAIKWREILNLKASPISNLQIENYSQRVQQDCYDYPALFLELIFGSGKSAIYVVVFTVSLLLSFSWVYLLALLSYAAIGSYLTRHIAYPLIKLNYDSQKAEATYRTALNAENFAECIRLLLGLARKTKHVTYLQYFYGQLGVIIPLVVIAPLYFTTNMTIGLLMRFNSTASTILDNLSYGVNNFTVINKLLSCRTRLKEINVI